MHLIDIAEFFIELKALIFQLLNQTLRLSLLSLVNRLVLAIQRKVPVKKTGGSGLSDVLRVFSHDTCVALGKVRCLM